MRVFVLGKRGAITGWLEGCVAGLIEAGHAVEVGATRNPALGSGLDRLLRSKWLGRPTARRLRRQINAFRPDLILVVSALDAPYDLIAPLAAMPGRPPLIGWCGDLFSEAERAQAALFDLVAYTDTAFAARHRELGFGPPAFYLPHAANPLLTAAAAPAERDARLLFVANPTPYRLALVDELSEPLRIVGPAWPPMPHAEHEVSARRVSLSELGGLYAAHAATLNARNEIKVLGGLNQRNFDPCRFGTAVVTDDQPDLELCFEPGHEQLVYADAAELTDLQRRLRREPDLALRVGEAGRRRVLSTHTYGHRLEKILATLGRRGIARLSATP